MMLQRLAPPLIASLLCLCAQSAYAASPTCVGRSIGVPYENPREPCFWAGCDLSDAAQLDRQWTGATVEPLIGAAGATPKLEARIVRSQATTEDDLFVEIRVRGEDVSDGSTINATLTGGATTTFAAGAGACTSDGTTLAPSECVGSADSGGLLLRMKYDDIAAPTDLVVDTIMTSAAGGCIGGSFAAGCVANYTFDLSFDAPTDSSCGGVRVDRESLGFRVGDTDPPIRKVDVGCGSPASGDPLLSTMGSLGIQVQTSVSANAGLRAEFKVASWGISTMDAFSTVLSGTADMTSGSSRLVHIHNDGDQFGVDWCALGTSGLEAHQCILAEVSGADAGSPIYPSTVYKNFNFPNLSVFRRAATIDVSHVPLPAGASHHTVFLELYKQNMPSPKSCSADVSAAATRVPQVDPRCHNVKLLAPGVPIDAPGRPKYVVWGYLDTGSSDDVNGISHRVLQPISSYAYYPVHDPSVPMAGGYETFLAGAEQISPNWYKLEIPEGHVATIVDTIRLLDADTKQCATWDGSSEGLEAEYRGCEDVTPKIRPACKLGECKHPDPCLYVDGSRLEFPPETPSEPEKPMSTGSGFSCCTTPTQRPNTPDPITSCLFVGFGLGLRRARRKAKRRA